MRNQRDEARKTVWKELIKVALPDSRFHYNFNEFIADYRGSEHATKLLTTLPEYQQAENLLITPDNNLTHLRVKAIADNKLTIMPTYGIVRGFLKITRQHVPQNQEAFAATLDGMDKFAESISLEEISKLSRLDLMVTGASAITSDGIRFGKGHGYFDLEWAMMREIGVVNENTPVVAFVHDCQLVDFQLDLAPHDTIVDFIITPTKKIEVISAHPKPAGIDWSKLPDEMRENIPPLNWLYQRDQKKGGVS